MKRAVIIDDEALARSLVREYLGEYPHIQVLAECENGFEGFKAIQSLEPDLVFLDVQMPKINGFEMLELLDKLPRVIFTTAFEEHALKAFELNAVDYLLKPFSKERFDKAIEKFLKGTEKDEDEKQIKTLLESSLRKDEQRNRIVVKNNAELKVIPVTELHYLEAYDDYVKLFTKDNYFLKKETLSNFEKDLDKTMFFRVHRSFIINLQELSGIEPMEKNAYIIRLRSGKKIPLSRNKYTELKDKLGF
ncbi:MAG TPA: LytTR family transcriptional regulator DNA-binding domain-containing protein [Bacteroidia bacterium]|nr:LytTR family transcriptional regulator DNA-binding domain-containing protein [Bacteroidia bacterium]